MNQAAAHFKAKGFECKLLNNARLNVWQCVGHLPPYPNDHQVAILIPDGYLTTPAPNLIVHLQGFPMRNSFLSELALYHLDHELPANALLIYPENSGARMRTYAEALYTREQFEALKNAALAFFDEVGLSHQEDVLHPQTQSLTLTGYSGAHLIISNILNTTKTEPLIDKIALFDATYWDTNDPNYNCILDFVKNPSVSLYIAFRENSETMKTADFLKSAIGSQENVKIVPLPSSIDHLNVMQNSYLDSLMWRAKLQLNATQMQKTTIPRDIENLAAKLLKYHSQKKHIEFQNNELKLQSICFQATFPRALQG